MEASFQIKKIGLQVYVALSVVFEATGKLHLATDQQPDDGAYWLLYNGKKCAVLAVLDGQITEPWPIPSESETENTGSSETPLCSALVYRSRAECNEVLLGYLEGAIAIIDGWSDPLSEDPLLKLTRTSIQGRIDREREGDLKEFLRDILDLAEIELKLYGYQSTEAVRSHLSRLEAIFAWKPERKQHFRLFTTLA